MIYDYSDYSTVKSQPVKYETISLKDGQYQVPSQVAKELTNMANIIEAQNIDINEARAKRREENEDIAERIIMNLISGEPYDRSVLKYKIDHFDRVENGQPVFEFRHEVERRILLALEGKGVDGVKGSIGKDVWKTV